MPDTSHCAECDAPLPDYWPRGLCTRCALEGALDMTHGESHVFQPGAVPACADLDPTPPARESSHLGSFGDYDLLEEIARGGMGVVYKARQRNLGRLVAVKLILGGAHAGREFVQRFRTEASTAALLQHPNIVAIHDVGVHQGQHYFSMDYVEGRNLAQLIGQQPLPANQAARYVELIAEAIHYAHEQGILHRDLKPSNVLIDGQDQPRITDFGLARRLEGESSLTVSGQVLGSPNFMPPEQAGAKRGTVGRPSDVYALGGILYYLLTARAPFHAESLEQIITQVLNVEPVPPRLLNPSIPRDLETIALKCLEKEPSRRYQTAQQLAGELGRVQRHEPILARPVNAPEKLWRWCRRKPALAGALGFGAAALVIGLATTSWQWRRAEGLAESERRERIAGQRQLYVARMNLAQAAWEQNNVSRVKQLLNETAPAPERGFEWYYWQRQMHLGLMALRGHTGPILAVAYSPNGHRIVTASADHTARIWEADTGNELFRLEGHTAPVSSVAFSQDGRWIVTASFDRTARIWDAPDWSYVRTLEGHTAANFSVACSSDGRRIVTGSQDQTARIWDAATGASLFTLTGHTGGVWAVAFSLDGQRVITGSWDETAKVWDATTGEEQRSLTGHRGAIFSVAFSPDGERVVTGGQDHRAKVWDLASGAEPRTLRGHSASILSVSFSRDGTQIITGSDDQTTRLWDAASGEERRVLKGHGSRIRSVALSPDARRIVTGGGTVRFSPDGQFFSPGTGDDRTARVWDAADSREGLTLEEHGAAVTSVDFSPDGRLVVSGSWDGTVRVRDVRTRQEISRIRAHQAVIRGVAFTPDGQRVVTGSFDRTARVWEIATGKELLKLVGHTAEVFAVAVSPDGRSIATGSWDKTVKLWDATTGANTHTFPAEEKFYTVGFSRDGQRLVTASGTGPAKVTVWEVGSRKALFSVRTAEHVWSAAFSNDGQRLVTGHHDLTARVWDAATGDEQLVLKGHTAHIHAARFSPDGSRILTGSDDQTAKLWDAATGQELLTFKGHASSIFAVAFAPDGQAIVSASGDRTVKLWQAASKEEVRKWQKEESIGEEKSASAPR